MSDKHTYELDGPTYEANGSQLFHSEQGDAVDVPEIDENRGLLTRFKRMFRSPLRLEIGDRFLEFWSEEQLEFALSGRTNVPVEKFAVLSKLSVHQLRAESERIKVVERHLGVVLEKSLVEPGETGKLLKDLETTVFSRDHNWRGIFESLNVQSDKYSVFKQVALGKYLQYLRARRNTLECLCRTREMTFPEQHMETDPAFTRAELHTVKVLKGDDQDRENAEPESLGFCDYVRLPRGESIEIRGLPESGMSLILGGHKFQLRGGEKFYLADDRGSEQPLRSAHNVIGRHTRSDVVIDQSYGGVSRRHLIVEPKTGGCAYLTDISTHGTFVPVKYVLVNKPD